jgi:hypothetical protein
LQAQLPDARAADALACPGTTVARCFDSGANRLVNVGAFFDRRSPVSESHYFLKYFEPPSGRARVEGFEFQANRGGIQFPACGLVRTSRGTPTFPSLDQLLSLQIADIVSDGPNRATCVDLAASNLVLEDGEAAWLVVQFPNPPDSAFVGVVAESDATDRPCDFFTRDSGEYWYRPDPQQSPLDWSFTVHYSPVTTKVRKRVPWWVVKGMHQ